MRHEQEVTAADGRPIYIRGKQLRHLIAAQHESALTVVRRALGGGVGIAAASRLLDVSDETLYRRAREWPELARVLAEGAMSFEEAGALGGAKDAKGRRVKAAKRG